MPGVDLKIIIQSLQTLYRDYEIYKCLKFKKNQNLYLISSETEGNTYMSKTGYQKDHSENKNSWKLKRKSRHLKKKIFNMLEIVEASSQKNRAKRERRNEN